MNKIENKKSRICSTCRIEKLLEDFYRSAKGPLGRQSRCKSCLSVYRKQNFSRNPEKNWVQNLKRMGLTPEKYEKIFNSQNGVCASCGEQETIIDKRTGKIRRLAIDHDHSCCPNKKACNKCIRGLLCQCCNQALGLLKDDPHKIKQLYNYAKEISL